MTSTVQYQAWVSSICLPAVNTARALAVALVLLISASHSAPAQTLTTLYSFSGGADGGHPYSGLLQDSSGNLYGTTYGDGLSYFGTAFRLDPNGQQTILHNFAGGQDGKLVYAGLLRDLSGNLYGTTGAGGASGVGTIFKLDKAGNKTLLYSFAGGSDGGGPYAALIRDAAGTLYGTTIGGGSSGAGTVFMLDTTGAETVLYSFMGSADGGNPQSRLLRDAAGNLYGTCSDGGAYGRGVVFKLDKTGKETVLHSFGSGADGEYPNGSLVRDASGNFYGTTLSGGAHDFGTVFKLSKNGSEIILYSFKGGADGAHPSAGVIRDAAGTLYGTTKSGGRSDLGTVFKVRNHTETVLYRFTGGSDGSVPLGGLVRSADGNLYGTTNASGAAGWGTVFKLSP